MKFGLMVCLVLVAIFATGCMSYDTAKYANGSHHSLTMLFPGQPYVDGNAQLVQNQPQQPSQMYVVQNGVLVPMANSQVLSNGTFVVTQPQQAQNNKLPLTPVFGINSGSPQQGYNGYYDSSGYGGCNQPVYGSGSCQSYSQGVVVSQPGFNYSYGGNRGGGRSGGQNYRY